MKVEVRDARVHLERSPEERLPLVHALNRIEGQVRGIRAMIEDDRYCGDELQQVKAVMSALSSVARMLVQQHVAASVQLMGDAASRKVAEADLALILQKALAI